MRLGVLSVGVCLVASGCASAGAVEDRSARAAATEALHPELAATAQRIAARIGEVSPERREALDALARFVASRRDAHAVARLTFICTHNSRRSHMGQLWATAAAAYYGVDGVEAFSGGTEATAFDARAIAALRRAGFRIEPVDGMPDNPHHAVTISEHGPIIDAFSKRYDDPPNPSEGFAAIMTCSTADRACPFVPGAALRVAVPYVDPKLSDGTPQQDATYDERSEEIATEMFYLFSKAAPPTSRTRSE